MGCPSVDTELDAAYGRMIFSNVFCTLVRASSRDENLSGKNLLLKTEISPFLGWHSYSCVYNQIRDVTVTGIILPY